MRRTRMGGSMRQPARRPGARLTVRPKHPTRKCRESPRLPGCYMGDHITNETDFVTPLPAHLEYRHLAAYPSLRMFHELLVQARVLPPRIQQLPVGAALDDSS